METTGIDLELALQPDPRRLTLAHLLEDACERHADRPALRFDGREWSYSELRDETRALARGLVAIGVGKGTRVALLLANRPEWIFAAFGAALAGAVVIPVNTYAPPSERDWILRHSDAAVLLLQDRLLKHEYVADLLASHPALNDMEVGRAQLPALPHLRCIHALGIDSERGAIGRWSDLIALGEQIDPSLLDARLAELHPADDGLVIYTSGTTAHPKGVLHRQRAAAIQSYRFAEYMELTPHDVVWTAQPFFWTAGIAMSLGSTLAAGGLLVLEDVFDPARALETIERERVTTVHAWPHQGKAMAEQPSAAKRDLSALTKIEFDSPLNQHVGLAADEWGIYCSYGLSETFTMATALPASAPADTRHGTNGLALPGMSLRILDPQSGAQLADPSEEGEIAVRGVTMMRGYYKLDPEVAFDDEGYFRTQDGGWIDDAGRLHWKGRLSNLIKTGGANVSPLEIEAAALECAGITAGLAIAVPHPTLGEAIVLCALAAENAQPEEQEIRRQLRERLAAYKVPRRVLFFSADEIAFTGTQKIQAGPLRTAALERLVAEDAEIEGHRYGVAGTSS